MKFYGAIWDSSLSRIGVTVTLYSEYNGLMISHGATNAVMCWATCFNAFALHSASSSDLCRHSAVTLEKRFDRARHAQRSIARCVGGWRRGATRRAVFEIQHDTTEIRNMVETGNTLPATSTLQFSERETSVVMSITCNFSSINCLEFIRNHWCKTTEQVISWSYDTVEWLHQDWCTLEFCLQNNDTECYI